MIPIATWGSDIQNSVSDTLVKLKQCVKNFDVDTTTIQNTTDLYKISQSIASLSKCLVDISRENRERTALIADIRLEFQHYLQAEWATNPKLAKEIEKLGAEVERKMLVHGPAPKL
jgi:hypothetical protein